MSTLDTVFLIITAVSLSLFFLLSTALIIYTWIIYRKIVKKAEQAIERVEDVTSIIRDVSRDGANSPLIKMLKFIIHLSRKE